MFGMIVLLKRRKQYKDQKLGRSGHGQLIVSYSARKSRTLLVSAVKTSLQWGALHCSQIDNCRLVKRYGQPTSWSRMKYNKIISEGAFVTLQIRFKARAMSAKDSPHFLTHSIPHILFNQCLWLTGNIFFFISKGQVTKKNIWSNS